MTSKLHDVLHGAEANYILPFFWQHGEEEKVLREEMARIHESGIGAVCVEARPHSDYLGPKWWHDIDVIMKEAKERGMRVWILDDDHFPTGHAAGRVHDAPKGLRRQFLSETHIDAIGPRSRSAFSVGPRPFIPGYGGGGELVGVIAIKRNATTGDLTEEALDLSNHVKNGMLYWDVPDGYWRIFSIVVSDSGGNPQQDDYINYLDAESVRILIDTVHEVFYERYQADFGGTLAGFFSDEPGFYNDKDTWDFNSKPGKLDVPLPWCKEMNGLIGKDFGFDYLKFLPFLWHDGGVNMSRIRYTYMDVVSKLYAKNFTAQIGDWCRERGVEYIGHILEDNNVHARLGSGAGHFFRALGGQDMSGLDVVLWQLRPGFDEFPVKGLTHGLDSEFFNYGMAKMAVSLSHIDVKKKGRTMAEVFGAYGWAEGLKLMKWLTDHMLVRGVNHFVPHAFSPKEFPDHDCPPHLYARGKNPQYRYYKYLNQYTNRISHLLSDGTHIATAAVLYHAEAEWSGEYMLFQKPVKELMRNQIDCDILPCDTIVDGVSLRDGKLVQLGESYDCLIIPYSEALPGQVLSCINDFAEQGLPVFFVNGLPSRTSDGERVEMVDKLDTNKQVEIVPLDELAKKLRESGYFEIESVGYQPYLRNYHMKHSDMDVFMFFNEHPFQEVDAEIYLPVTGRVLMYDAYNNALVESESEVKGDRSKLKVHLLPTESIIVLSGDGLDALDAQEQISIGKPSMSIDGSWEVAIATAEQYPAFTPWGQIGELDDLTQNVSQLSSFSGTFRYETTFNMSTESGNRVVLDLGEVYETAEVFVNGESAGVRIAAPYRFDIESLLQEGSNTLVVEVTNTLVKENLDYFSRVAQLEPSGLIGPVQLLQKKEI